MEPKSQGKRGKGGGMATLSFSIEWSTIRK